MSWQKTIVIGGIQGEGVASTGLNLMKSLARIGYFAYGERTFSSRIKGGNTQIALTISDEPVQCVTSQINVLLAYDDETVQLNAGHMAPDGMIMMDDVISLSEKVETSGLLVKLPLTNLAKEYGSLLMKNTSAIGFLGKMLKIDLRVLVESTIQSYQKKGEVTVQQNLKVLKAAYAEPHSQLESFEGMPPMRKKSEPMMMLMGNDAITLGALMAGCRFMAAYPITPASDVMETMSRALPEEKGIMIQAEDEVAAVTMCIGASYAGVRSMTATSGPGLTLMMEGMGLAGMTETPLVLVDAQRSGPSTGMPTRTEQSDISSLYHAGHGEFPMIILSPSTIEECYCLAFEAFDLADRYQCPVVILSDLNLSLSSQTVKALSYEPKLINRGELADVGVLLEKTDEPFPRYALTESGISPRSFPGMPNGIHQVTGLEHNEWGRPSDKAVNRSKMMDKRKRKLEPLVNQNAVRVNQKDGHYLCLTFGSPWGVLQEALRESDLPIDTATINRIRPLPERQLNQLFKDYRKIIVMEQNQQGQLAGILRKELNLPDKIVSLNRFDGASFHTSEVREQLERWCEEWK